MENRQETKLTINEVARLCGVSKTTISRFLNGKYDNMSVETRERISSVVSGLDFHPNRSAQRLKAKRAMLIGCVLADISSPFSAIVLKGIASRCDEAGYHVLFADSQEDPEKERKAIQGFLENGVDGLLINTTGGNETFLAELRDRLPVVLVDRQTATGEFDEVCSPNEEIAYNTTRLLFDMGYDSVIFISGDIRVISPRVERRKGYISAVESRQRLPICFRFDSDNPSVCTDFISGFLKHHPGERPALLCVNGVTALYTLIALSSLDIKLGEELGFITFDDWSWLQISKTSISTIQLGTVEKGIAAARLLIQRIEGSADIAPAPQHICIPSQLILRGSTLELGAK